ncbi:MAG: Nramp family divalent metal transporter [Patescibacteria group bacterium]|nr:Nramp family divalent metal transporter [Patescibacteria group bacterium]
MERKLERLVESPAIFLGHAISLSQLVGSTIKNQKHVKKGKEYWDNLGPGLTTGASDDDPSGIATYSQTGAQFGFQLLWLAPLTFPLMAIVQEMCARIGLVTGQGLAGNIRDHFPKWILYLSTILLLIANTLNIGADLGAMAKATQLLFPNINFGLLVFIFTAFSLGLQIFTPYEKYAKYLKWLALILLSYVLSAFMVNINWGHLLSHAVIPAITFSKNQIILVCAILGTTISPYLFFWQTSQEVEEDIKKGKDTLELRKGCSDEDVKKMRIDVWSGMFLSNLVMFFIIAACAATLYSHGITNITTAADAAAALRPIAGDYTYLLFTLGIIGTGLLAVPVLAGAASYCLSESLGWQYGLHHQLKEANAFYGVIIISMAVGLALNFIGLDAIKTLIYSAVVNGLIAPVILALIVLLSSSKKLMGDRINHPAISFLGWIITGLMAAAGIGTILSLF